MAINRSEVRRRVRTVTALVACGAAAVTAGAAFGASRGSAAAKPTAASSGGSDATQAQDQVPQTTVPQDQQGFEPPSSSTAPPQGMSGGS